MIKKIKEEKIASVYIWEWVKQGWKLICKIEIKKVEIGNKRNC